MQCILTMEHYSAVNRNEALTLATTLMNLEAMMLSESQTQKDMQCRSLCV